MPRRYGRILTMIALSLACVSQAGAEATHAAKATTGIDSSPLAMVAGTVISAARFREEMARRSPTFDAARAEEVMDGMVRDELLFSAARTAGYENDPEVIAAFRQAMVARYLRDNLEPKLARVTATDQEVATYYRSHLAEFGAGSAVHAALIRIAVPPKASGEKQADLLRLAEQARREALALEPGVPAFGRVAVSYSQDQGSRYRGGDIGWLQAGESRWDPKVTAAIFRLTAPGQVSPVIVAADGLYIVKLVETRPARVKPLAEVRDGVRYHLIREKRRRIESELLEQLKKQIPVSVDRGALLAIARSAGEAQPPPSLPAR